jgi:large subunit ribosomal protein L27
MAHKKGLGSSRNGRDSNSKRLGVKVFAGQTVTGGEIIVRQRGTRFKAGDGVGIGKDDSLYARAAGTVAFSRGWRGRVVSVVGPDGVAIVAPPRPRKAKPAAEETVAVAEPAAGEPAADDEPAAAD